MNRTLALITALLALCGGCATPVEVKQATTALDAAYDDNIALMRRYRDAVDSMNQLHHSWSRYIATRNYLNMALQCATVDLGDEILKKRYDRLESDLQSWVNENRLAPLPAKGGFKAGTKTMGALVEALPALIPLVKKRAEAGITAQDLRAFDEYARNVAVLKASNKAVKEYLDVDVTISKDDFQGLKDAIQELGKKP